MRTYANILIISNRMEDTLYKIIEFKKNDFSWFSLSFLF